MVRFRVNFFLKNKVNFGEQNFAPSYTHPKNCLLTC